MDVMSSFSLTRQYKITTGFFSENTIVVVEGEMLVEGIFQVLLRMPFSTSVIVCSMFSKTKENVILFHM